MGADYPDFLDALTDYFDSETWRSKQVRRTLEKATQAGTLAVALDGQHKSELARMVDYRDHEEMKLAALALNRAERIKLERNQALVEMAKRMRFAIACAMGRDAIDETTANTGLDEDDRVMVSQVSGRVTRW